MNLYLDSSALVKRYIRESGSDDVADSVTAASFVGISVIGRAEVEAALAMAVRLGVIAPAGGGSAREALAAHWDSLVRIAVTEALAARAGSVAWRHGLRGYDSVHLASALTWRDGTGESVTVATYDQGLHRACAAEGFTLIPGALP